jgi:hypothetical protein
VDAKMFWIALYAVSFVIRSSKARQLTLARHSQFPAAWVLLFFVGLLKFNLSFLPIVLLALVFNITNTVGYTYAVRLTFADPLGAIRRAFD